MASAAADEPERDVCDGTMEGSIRPLGYHVTSARTPTPERVLQRLKRDASYRISDSLTTRQLAHVAIFRLGQCARGAWVGSSVAACGGLLFVGRRVTIRHRRQLSVGRAVILDDGCLLDAMSADGIVLGDNVSIGRNSELRGSGVFWQPGVGIRIGNNVGVGPACYIGGQGGVTIGDDVIIGPGAMIVSEDHNFDDPSQPIRVQGTRRRQVTIQANCWLGGRAIILSGVTIGQGSVIAAGAVVTRDVPPRSVVAGVPGRVVKTAGTSSRQGCSESTGQPVPTEPVRTR